jgi:hypothetical protein
MLFPAHGGIFLRISDTGSSVISKLVPNPRLNATVGFVYTFVGDSAYRPLISADYSYVGDRLSANNSPQNTPLVEPAYAILNARVGVKSGHSELSLYCNNITEEKANLGDIQQNDFPQSIKNAGGQTVPYLEVGVLPPLQPRLSELVAPRRLAQFSLEPPVCHREFPRADSR